MVAAAIFGALDTVFVADLNTVGAGLGEGAFTTLCRDVAPRWVDAVVLGALAVTNTVGAGLGEGRAVTLGRDAVWGWAETTATCGLGSDFFAVVKTVGAGAAEGGAATLA